MKTLLLKKLYTISEQFFKAPALLHTFLNIGKHIPLSFTVFTGTQKEEEIYVRLIDSQTKQVHMHSD